MSSSIFEQTGWKRPYSRQICQEHDILLKITEYSYDLNNEEFVKYFISRTGILILKEDRPDISYFTLAFPFEQVEEWLLYSPNYTRLDGQPVDPESRKFDVKINKLIRGRLQDCWELWITDQNNE